MTKYTLRLRLTSTEEGEHRDSEKRRRNLHLSRLSTKLELCNVLLLESLGAADATATCMGPFIDVCTPSNKLII